MRLDTVPSGQTKGTRQGAGPQLLSEGGEVRVTSQPSCQSKPKKVGDILELAEDSVDHLGKECCMQDNALTFRSLCMGFERKVTITFCDLGIFLCTPPLACKAALLLTAMTTPLEDAMDTLIRIFHHYSGKEGDRNKLSKGELKELLTSELTDFLSGQKDPLLVDKIMNDLDSNKDNEVDFNEFVILVAALTVACNDFFEEQLKKEEF
nr:protein S100-Z [Agelaius phoeniceus]